MRAKVRINLGFMAWMRLRKIYADQPVSWLLDLQNFVAGIWLSTLGKLVSVLSKRNQENQEVIFIIGHWRSGTTFLHELLCSNPGFSFPTTYACMNPQIFPITEEAVLRSVGDKSVKRPMDNMNISLASPQEDEFALLALGAPSPYEGLLFPEALNRGMSFADPSDLSEDEKLGWIRVFTQFVGQVASSKRGGAVVLKSPTHSYRVKLLVQLFPRARFIHIVRNPLEVYSSTLYMWKKLCSLYAMTNLPDEDEFASFVVNNWIRLEKKLDADLPSLKNGNYTRVHYESLISYPLIEMERVYTELQLDGFVEAVPNMERYLTSCAGFEKNNFDLTPDQANAVFLAWGHIFEKYGYSYPTLST